MLEPAQSLRLGAGLGAKGHRKPSKKKRLPASDRFIAVSRQLSASRRLNKIAVSKFTICNSSRRLLLFRISHDPAA
jgi:hypothetical protein